MSPRLFGPWLAASWAVLALGANAAEDPPAKALFLQHCASCHGENGDGKGTAKLERPARNFREGGFSNGNTPEAIFRTLTFGIPGTPMASFAQTLPEPQRRELAQFVITLGPPPDPNDAPGKSVLVVGELPLVVRGKLPPLAADGPELPWGLLLGTPDGFSFEYRYDDLRLLAVRQGGFVDRTDWSGRGGTALKPLGHVLLGMRSADPGPFAQEFLPEGGLAALASRATGTRVEGARVWLGAECRRASGASVASFEEACRGWSFAKGAGYRRELRLRGGASAVRLALHVRELAGRTLLARGPAWLVCKLESGGFEALFVDGLRAGEGFGAPSGSTGASEAAQPWLQLELGAQQARALAITTISAPEWTDAIQAQWLAEVAR